MKRILSLVVLLIWFSSIEAQTTRYVKTIASGTGDGSSWANASASLQTIITASAADDQVWVAAGTYMPSSNSSFSMKTGVAIYGGFAGTETLLSQRNWVTNVTILQGNGAVVINNSGLSSTALLDGFTITGGTAGGTGLTPKSGGMNNSSSSPTIVNCIFKNNTTTGGFGPGAFGGGGAMHNNSSSPTITNCIFLNNTASGVGGAMANYNGANPVITNCSFYGNNASVAKALYQYNASTPVLKNCIVWDGSGEFANNFGNNPIVTYSDVAGGFAGTGNINADPLFVNATSGNLQLSTGSPAINTGSSAAVPGGVTVDLANATRIVGASVDMGAYEYFPVGASLNFDGVNDYVSISNPFTAFNKEITVEFWMSAASANITVGSIMSQGVEGQDNMANDVWMMHPNNDGTATFYVNDAGAFRTANFNITAGSWHHIAGVAGPFGIKVYVDGVLSGTGAGITGTILNNASSVIHIGKDVRWAANVDPRFGNITLDEVRIWNRALCQDEIVNNKNCQPNPATQTGLQEYYRFNQGVEDGTNTGITTLTDNSGNGRDGVLNNFALTAGATSNWTSSGSTNTGTCATYVAPTAAITGITTVCIGSGSALSNTNAGGVWTSSNAGVATINATTGAVATVSAGTTTITYTTECGGVSTATVTVNALPTLLPATASICVGLSTTLTGNGTPAVSNPYVSSNTAVATVTSLGVVAALSAGTATITYTNNSGCSATSAITVNALPTLLPATASICVGANTTLVGSGTPAVSNAWISSNTAVATVTSLGLVTALSAGTATITYTNNSGCSATSAITVNALPTLLPATASICVGANTTLVGSGTPAVSNAWASSNTSIASVSNLGVVAGVAGGTATITYNNIAGCSATASVTIRTDVNFGNALNFSSNEIAGTNANLPQGNGARTIEAWIKYNTGNDMTIFQYGQKGTATNQQFVLHLFQGVYIIGLFNDIQTNYQVNDNNWHHLAVTHDGTTTKVYVDGNVIASVAKSYATNGTGFQIGFSDRGAKGFYYTGNMDEVRVWNVARTQAQIQASMNSELIGNETGLVAYYNFNQGVAGGTNTTVTTLHDLVSPPHNGTLATFPLTGSTGNWVSGYANVVAPITGTSSVCAGNTITLANATGGGVWISSNPSIATVNGSGLVSGLSAGIDTIYYSLPGVFSCNNVASFIVTVKAASASTTNVSVCAAALPYTWNGINYSTAGTYSKVFVGGNAAGCDSTASLVLTVKQATTSTTNVSVCAAALPYTWNGSSYSTAGTYSKIFIGGNAAGCDSAASLVLTVKQATTSTTNVSVCAAALPYSWNGSSYSTAGTYSKIFIGGNAAGCDSAASLVLTVKQATTSTTNVSVCAAALPYSWNGSSYSTAGTYSKIFIGGNAGGCDSTANLILTVKQATTSTTNVSVCAAALPYTWNGSSYSTVGTYSKIFIGGNAAGCDSTASLVLTVKQTTTSTTNVSVCAAALPYTWNGINYSTAGTYSKVFVGGNAAGCDSTASLVLTVKQATSSTTTISVCAATLPYSWNGNSYATAGTYSVSLTNANGCDSIASLILSIFQTVASNTNVSICSTALPYSWNGISYSTAGTYSKTFIGGSIGGCDSIATLSLTLKQASTSTTNVSVCATALPYSWNGRSYTSAGTYTAILQNTLGCDSTATLVLSIKQVSTSTTNVSTCASALPYSWNGKSYASAGTYTASLQNSLGCDSTATLVLTTKQVSTSTTNVSVCASALPYSWNGKSYASAGTYTASLQNSLGCDSTANLVLTTKQVSTSTTNVSICASALPYSWNGRSYSLSGTYTALLTNAAGCDSTASLVLTVNANPATPVISNSRPLSFCTGDSTILISSASTNNRWLLNNTIISGAVSSQFITKISGIYSVQVVNASGCTATSASVTTTNRSTLGSGLATHDTLICKTTSINIAATAGLPATYLWSSAKTGFVSTASQVNISAADIYKVRITLSNGCVVTDSINLRNTADTAIKARLSVTGHAFVNQTLALINVTNPAPQSQNWVLPTAATILLRTDSVVLMRFASVGNHMVYLTNRSYNVCSSADTAKIVITTNDSSNVVAAVPIVVRNITIGPNPTTGIMNIGIELNQLGKTSLRIYDGSGTLTYSKNILPLAVKFTERVDISPAPSNRTYVLVVQTKDGYEVRTIIKL